MDMNFLKLDINNINDNSGIEEVSNDDIAIIGMACTMPMADNYRNYWDNILGKRNCTREIPKSRLNDVSTFYKSIKGTKDNNVSYKKAAYLDEIDKFDYKFFNLNKIEAELMDPHQRLFLKTAYEAIEDSGYNFTQLKGSNTGVFVGCSDFLNYKYFDLVKSTRPEDVDISTTGNIQSIIPSRVSYLLDLKGPAMAIDTACSSSLVAINAACTSIKNAECNVALVGSVHLLLLPIDNELKLGIESGDQITKAFDDSSDGTGTGEGAGVIVLKSLAEAVRDNDNIYAIIKGSYVNQDGNSIGISAPNIKAQEEVLINSWDKAKINPEELDYIEAHGTGTQLGDTVEISALTNAFRNYTSKQQFCAISSVKSNIGHILDTSGIASIIKAALAIKNKVIPPTTNFNLPNRKIDFEQSPLYINDQAKRWTANNKIRTCGISSFGMSGTNCHLVLQEYADKYNKNEYIKDSNFNILTLSAKTENSLINLVRKYIGFLDEDTYININNLCYTANIGRENYNYRLAIIFNNINDLKIGLNSFLNGSQESLESLGIYYNDGSVNLDKEELEKLEININEIYDKRNLKLLAKYYINFGKINWNEYYKDKYKKISIPTYAFDEERCWCEKEIKEIDKFDNKIDSIEENLVKLFKDELGYDDLDVNTNFSDVGIDSIFVLKINKMINNLYPNVISVSDFFNYPSIKELSDHMREVLKKSKEPIIKLKSESKEILDEDVAIIGIDMKVGEANNKEEFFNKLINGEDFIREFPKERINDSKNIVKRFYNKECDFSKGAFLKEIDKFDYKFFNISKQEAIWMDPNQRLFLESAVRAIGDSGYKIEELSGSNTGVYVGFGMDYLCNYGRLIAEIEPESIGISTTGNIASIISGRLAYYLNLKGPNMVIDTSCSSSLVALYQAVRGIRCGDCNLAIVGGVKINLAPIVVDENSIGMDSKEFKTKAFDDNADGAAIGEGVGTILIKPLKKALEDNDHIYSVIKGIGLNHDGKSFGLTAPNAKSQSEVLKNAWKDAKINPKSISYIEAHGTGTRLGDPIEVSGIENAFKDYTENFQFCGIGSLKTNIGHLYEASGIAGVIKLALSLENKVIPKMINLSFPNREIGFETSPVYIADKNIVWNDNDDIKTCGINGFGFSGTNCHIVMQEAPRGYTCKTINKNYSFEKNRCWIEEHEDNDITTLNTNLKEVISQKYSLEEKLITIYNNILGINNISVDDNFYSLGGDSILAIKVAKSIEEHVNIKLNISDILEYETISKLSKHINEKNINDSNDDNKIITLASEKKYYNVSAAQKRMFLVTQKLNMDIAYNIPIKMEIRGRLDCNKVRDVLTMIMDRHEVLRTTFDIINDEVVQIIHKKTIFNLDVYEGNEEQANEIIRKFVRSFDLKKCPLFRATLINLSELEHILLFDIHHIISDFISMGVFVKEFIALYENKVPDKLDIQYKDFAEWHNNYLLSPEVEKQKQYWINKFNDIPDKLNLPCSNKEIVHNSSEELSFKIDTNIIKNLNYISEKENVSMFMILFAAYNILLSKYSNSNDIVVGTPISGRHHLQTENLIGVFINTLPIRTVIDSKSSYIEVLNDIKKNCLEAFNNQDIQFEDMLEILREKNNDPNITLFNSLFVMQNGEMPNVKIDGLDINCEPLKNKQAIFDLHWEVIDLGRELQFNISYRNELFDNTVIRAMSIHYINIIKTICKDARIKIREIDYLNHYEKNMVLSNFNAGYKNNDEDCILDYFHRQVYKTPDNSAVFYDGLNITYKDLNERANSLASRLLEMEIGDNEIVAIMMNKSIEMIVSIIAVLKSGCAYMPIDPEYPLSRKKYMLNDSNSRIILTQENLVPQIDYYDGIILDVNDDSNYVKTNQNINLRKSNEDLLYVIYTSGTTGNPKGIMFKNKGLVNLIKHEYNNTEIKFNNNVLQFATICFDVASQEIFSCLLAGGRLCIIDDYSKKDVKKLSNFIVKNEIETIFLPTAYFEFLCTNTGFVECILDTTKDIIVAGEVLKINDKIAEKLRNSSISVHNHYGPSETHVITTYTIRPDDIHECVPPIGRPIDNTHIYILDDNKNLVPIGVEGILYVSGTCLSQGYLNKQDLTKEKFIPNPFEKDQLMYNTGDLVKWLPDGNIDFIGRKDCQVKIRGYRIELNEVQNAVMGISDINEVAALDIRKEESCYLCCYYVANREISSHEFRDSLKQKLPNYMLPSYYIKVDSIPLNLNGKIDKKKLPIPEGNIDTNINYEAPRNEIERKIVMIWEEILGTEGIGINDNFYDLGGQSLKATLLNSKIKEKLKIDIPLSVLFTKLTVKELSEYIEKGTFNCKDYIIFNEHAQKNIICFPPSLGYGFVFNKLSEKLKDYKMYCYNFVYSNNIIEDYVERILRISNDREFVFLGYSAGGKLAVEIADKMNKMGYSVTDIILIDSMPLNFKQKYTDYSYRVSKEELFQIVSQNMPEYINFIDNNAYENMANYLKYYDSFSNVKEIDSKLHLILMPDNYRKIEGVDNLKIYNMWKQITNEVIMYNGVGKHQYMLTEDNIDENSKIIFNIIDKIQF
ncbi:non-ribosomal peptide synthetase [Clostridium beijerinckii]|uniref:non-ribosomal peptide synthetase n=1 Tax=Clostridium beijerinckii TaxID=1520 RepID=UPI00080A2168|nr:non-ribosomal peptide synthetase [Clostridium beijerinckii]OCA96721.1 hypothetical protein BGS1_05570 [Clostridium beijerinckii]